MADLPDVRPGQIWADNDGRSQGRKVKVLEVHQGEREPYAIVQVIAVAHGSLPLDPKKPRKTRVVLRRFRPNSTGYRLETDV